MHEIRRSVHFFENIFEKNLKKGLIFRFGCDNIIGQLAITMNERSRIMAWYEILIGVILVVASVLLVIIVLMQQSRQAGLSGAIAGGSDSFFGKNKGRTMDAKLAKITKILSVFFFVFTILATFFIAFMQAKN